MNANEGTERRNSQADDDAPQTDDDDDSSSLSPIDAVLGSNADPEEQRRLYQQAQVEFAEIASACMLRKGFTYRFAVQDPPPVAAFVDTGLSDTDLVARHGYGIGFVDDAVDRVVNAKLVPPESRIDSETSENPDFWLARDDCRREAERAVPNPNQLPSLVVERVAEFRQDLNASPELERIWSDWSSCMAKQGYTYANRQQVYAEFQGPTQSLMAEIIGLGPKGGITADIEARIDGLRSAESIVIESDVGCADGVALDERLTQFRYDAGSDFIALHGDLLLLELSG